LPAPPTPLPPAVGVAPDNPGTLQGSVLLPHDAESMSMPHTNVAPRRMDVSPCGLDRPACGRSLRLTEACYTIPALAISEQRSTLNSNHFTERFFDTAMELPCPTNPSVYFIGQVVAFARLRYVDGRAYQMPVTSLDGRCSKRRGPLPGREGAAIGGFVLKRGACTGAFGRLSR